MSQPSGAGQSTTTVAKRMTPGVAPLRRCGAIGPKATSVAIRGLWILWAATLFGGSLLAEIPPLQSLFAADSPERHESIRLIAHLGSSAVLVTAGWIWFLGYFRSPAASVIALIATGMTLGAIGDCFNAGVLQEFVRLPDPVLGGIAAFGLGHVAYITACLLVARRCGFHSRAKRFAAVAFWQGVGLLGWFFVVYHGTNSGARMLVWPALPYSLLLAATAGLATHLALENHRLCPLGIGAALFLISDLILAFRLFHGDFSLASHAVWMTYGPGQMLIVYSIGAIRKVLPSTENPAPP